MKKIKEKIVICFVVLMMMVTQMPTSQLINAQDNAVFSVSVTEIDTDTKRIDVQEVSESITKIEFLREGESIETKEIGEDLSFNVYNNGTYTIIGYDATEAQVSEESVTINDFENLTIEKDENHVVRIVSRYPFTSEVLVNDTDSVSMENTGLGYYEGTYSILQNGDYTFVVYANGVEEDRTTMAFTDLPVVEEPGVEEPGTGEPGIEEPGTGEPDVPGIEGPETGLPEEGAPGVGLPEENQPIINEAGEIIISSEADIIQLLNNPTASFILANDIELTSNVLSEVNFSGTLNGNGYMISGFSDSLFLAIENATINNVVLQGALAQTSYNSTINDSGFYIEVSDETQDIAVLLNSESTTINNSFVLMNGEGARVAGFILEGTGTINNSYVSGYLKGEEVFGFGQEVEVNNSYMNASLVGEKRTLFTNLENGVSDDSFYDIQINDMEDEFATPMYTKDLISKEYSNDEFTIIEGQYPQIKNIHLMSEKAQQVSTLSVLSVITDSNLSALEGIVETEEIVDIEWVQSAEEISANTNTFMNRFALRQAEVSTDIKAGSQTTAKTTQVSFPITMGKYYKIIKTNDGEPISPTTHEEAIADGWKIMYWSGTYRQTGLNWNTNYTIYSTDLSTLSTDGTITTNFGDNGGKLTLTGNYEIGQEMTATLSGTNTNEGVLTWKYVPIIGIGAVPTAFSASTTEVTMEMPESGVLTYTVPNVPAVIVNNYLKIIFVTKESTGYQGTLSDATTKIIKEEINAVTIENRTAVLEGRTEGKFILGDELVTNMDPVGYENEVTFKWFQADNNGSMEHVDFTNPIAIGRNYKIDGSDIGKQLFVRAEAKEEGRFKEYKDSAVTAEVEGIKNLAPDISQLETKNIEDIAVILTMNATEGLYRYGYSVSTEATDMNSLIIHPVLSRNQTDTTITGLTPNTTYYFFVQRVGENGYGDSDWSSDSLLVTTEKENVKGDVLINGNYVYNQVLTASISNNPDNQTGQFVWYRLDGDGKRVGVALATDSNTYTLVQADIGAKLEVAYVGTVNYAGEIAVSTDTIIKEEKTAPTTNLTVQNFEDNWIEVKMPQNTDSEKYIIGISSTQDGIPVEVLDQGTVKELASEEIYKIENLQRDSDHYLFVRYASNETHEKSDWIDATKAVLTKTKKKTFTGSIDFTYEITLDKLMVGQRLTATVNPSDADFNFRGEWKWYKINNGTEVEVTNFTMTDDKEGTTYIVPEGTQIGATYRVTFEAAVGYEGTIEAISNPVVPSEKAKYANPDASKIIMEAVDDSSIKVKMGEGDGLYRFWYKKADSNAITSFVGFLKNLVAAADGYEDTGVTVSANTEVILDDLIRNTKYIVKVQRVEDSEGNASDFVYSNDAGIFAVTKKTEIAGNVTITGVERYNETLTATYNPANYASTGSTNDTNGKWQWYRNNQAITGATTSTYKTTVADVGFILKAEYKMAENDNFEGKTSTETRKIEKAISQNPEVINVESVINSTSKQMNIKITGTESSGSAKIYYRVQLKGEAVPSFPDSTELINWTESSGSITTMTVDSNGREFRPKTEYVVYIIRIATETHEGSPVIAKEFEAGTMTQTGSIAYTGRTHVGKELTATLSLHNNIVGEWHWYYSNTDYTNANPSAWTEVKSGFSPKDNSLTSTLLVPDEAKGKYIKAKFTSTDEKYAGTVESVSATTVTKTFTEKLTISGKGYTGETLTVKLEGSDRDLTKTTSTTGPNQLFNTRKVELRRDTSNFWEPITKNITRDSFQVELTEYDKRADDKYLRAFINMPDTNIYTEESGAVITDVYLYSSVDERIQFHYGTPITNLADFKNFLARTGNYSNRDGGTFVITNNIKITDANPLNYSPSIFKGTLNGDYHTITGLKNPLFYYLAGEPYNKAVVKNLIIYDGKITLSGGATTALGNSGGIISRGAKDVLLENIFLAQTDLEATYDTGYFLGKATGGVYMLNCGSAGGSTNVPNGGTVSVGGVIGSINNENGYNIGSSTVMSLLKNIFSINTKIIPTGSSNVVNSGGILGAGGDDDPTGNSYTKAESIYIASSINSSRTGSAGAFSANANPSGPIYYDNTTMTNLTNNTTNSVGLSTKNMIGDGLKGRSNFDASAWEFKDGFYPQLNWLKEHPISNLYAATRGAFTSVDGRTTPENMFNGNISGPIEIPKEFQNSTYSIRSNNANLTVKNNTIIPTGSNGSSGEIKITYTEPDASIGGSVSNTYVFTVGSKTNAMLKAELTGTAKYGETLSVDTNSVATTYQWYRIDLDGNKTKISNEVNASYKLTSTDIGKRITVLVGAPGYASMFSDNSDIVISTTPTSGPSIIFSTDSTIKLKQSGFSGVKYEFAYEEPNSSTKNIISGVYDSEEVVTIDKFSRNTTYKVYARVAGGTGYEASAWSLATSFKTLQTDIVGEVVLGTGINNGQQLSLTVPKTHDQKGSWKLERMSADGNSKIGDINFTSAEHLINYTLIDADVGYRIKATFTGTGDFKGSISNTSEVVKKSNSSAPNSPSFVSSDDKSIVVTQNGTATYDIGYASEANGQILVSLSNQNGNTNLTIPNLSRNKTYYVYTRLVSTSITEASPWSTPTQMSTKKSGVTGPISIAGELKTDATITFNAPQTNNQTGVWKLERIEGAAVTTISPSAYSIDNNGRNLSYVLTPRDTKAKLKATFIGNGDFNNSIDITTSVIQEENQSEDDIPEATDIEVSSIKDYSFAIKTTTGADNYQFGYVLKDGQLDTITEIEAVVGNNVPVTISGLKRNTEYDVYMRKASKIGYLVGDWHKMKTVRTDKSSLTGSIKYVIKNADGSTKPAKPGVAAVNVTYHTTYEKGKYAQVGDDSQAGEWQWFADNVVIPNANSDTYTVEPMLGNKEISVQYIAKDDNDFKDTRRAIIGTLTKPAFSIPLLPSVVTLNEDGEKGSKLKITTAVVDNVYFYVQKASNLIIPTTVTQVDAKDNEMKADQWFKAEATSTLVLEADTEYVVFVARLENGYQTSSGVISQRAVRTVKENLNQLVSIQIEEADNNPWKAQQAKELRISNGGQAVDGVWQYYVKEAKDNASWQNITSEIKGGVEEGSNSEYTFTRVALPLKYSNNYFVKVVFTGRGAYTGSTTYLTNEKLVGKNIKGHVEIISSLQLNEVFVPIRVKYVYANDIQGNEIVDEDNGVWTWYLETAKDSDVFEKIQRVTDTVGLVDEYRPTANDVDKKIYALYSVAPSSVYSGSVKSSTLSNVKRSVQNVPTISLKQVNGNNVEVNLPNNQKSDGKTIAQPRLYYRIKDDVDVSWKENPVGNAWITGLKAKTVYEVKVIFDGTTEYLPSESSNILEITTENQLFDVDKLIISEPAKLENGTEITVTYNGAGYDEGHFEFERSDGTPIAKNVETKITKGFFFFRSGSASTSYTVKDADVGYNIVIKFVANADATTYGGFIEKSTKDVIKALSTETPTAPTLEKVDFSETKLKVLVEDAYEYVLNESSSTVVKESEWKKLTKDVDGYYTFTGLDKTKSYYLHTRIAETQFKGVSNEVVSLDVKPWARTTYTITYDGVDGASHNNPTSYTELTPEITLTDATKTGHTFKGWTVANDTTSVTTIPFHSSGNKTFIANWTVNQYTATFNSNGGSVVSDKTLDYNSKLGNLPTPTKEGYDFKGWHTALTGGIQISENTPMPADNVTYYAHWEISKYTVTFESNGGTTVEPMVIEWKENVTKPADPTKVKHKFIGWYKEDTLTNLWDFANDTVTAPVTLYAKYIETLNKVKADKDPSIQIKKRDKVTLSAEEGTTIYFTTDGNDPTVSSTQYTEAITIDKEVTIKAIAAKANCENSEIATFEYNIIGNLNITRPDANSLIQVKNTDDEIAKAVLTPQEYDEYSKGKDVAIRITVETVEGTVTDIITNALNGRTIAQQFEIKVYKTMENGSETEVTKLTNKLTFIITVPSNLYPPSGTTRTFDVLRIYNNVTSFLSDSDNDSKTVTFESDEFIDHILTYKDKKNDPPVNPDRPGKPDKPENPEVPVDPDKPENPEVPVDPDNPGEPGKPGDPDTPVIGGDPDKPSPEVPGEDGTIDQGGTTVKPGPDGELPTVKPDGTIDVPNGGGANIGGNDVILPDGGTVNKDGSVTIPKEGKVEINGNTIEIADGGTINKDGSISIKAGSTVIINGKEVYFDKEGTIHPDGSYEKSKFSINDLISPAWILMYIGGFIALSIRRKEEK